MGRVFITKLKILISSSEIMSFPTILENAMFLHKEICRWVIFYISSAMFRTLNSKHHNIIDLRISNIIFSCFMLHILNIELLFSLYLQCVLDTDVGVSSALNATKFSESLCTTMLGRSSNHGDDISGSHGEIISGSHDDHISGSHSGNISGSHGNNISGSHSDNISGSHGDNISPKTSSSSSSCDADGCGQSNRVDSSCCGGGTASSYTSKQ